MGSPERERKTSFPAPGTVLPVPGTTPTTPYSAVFLNRRFSVAPASSPLSPRSPTSSRRGSQVRSELAREFITRDRALQQLPILGSILVQTKRPIQYDETILLPVPYPSAWTETIRYIETHNAEHLSESVKVNILNLGGKLPCV
ncbi:uncharacterized protein F5Z01DRAFT_672561 [Emericellopsis atlantica]|uniref:Uncharacterized protein n=1 Tax=Emericellopsis atlantica TaxID=2614577 RepID=A0A9P8CSN0_9HYPO|nr:uncharacterized protein F5Z01DRAFT_672561 [Emericellopsis atlantica]KAG9255916.1 hypothetical protein F5Z01DRAFT_672561 [Emericellopsis atlantica]